MKSHQRLDILIGCFNSDNLGVITEFGKEETPELQEKLFEVGSLIPRRIGEKVEWQQITRTYQLNYRKYHKIKLSLSAMVQLDHRYYLNLARRL